MSDKDQVVKAVRATLLSVKGAISIRQCNKDYKDLQGEWIPFKNLGYPTLEIFFQEIPGFRIIQREGEWYVDAIPTEATQHIAEMVSRQKSSKKSKSYHPNRFPRKQGPWRKSCSASNYNNQYHRANTAGPPCYNNNKHSNYNNNNNDHTNRTEPKVTTYPGKPLPKLTETNRTVPTRRCNAAPQSLRDVNTLTEEVKPSVRTKPEVKPISKMTASQRLSNLRDRISTVDPIQLQMPADNNKSLESSDSGDPVAHAAPAPMLEPPPDCTTAVAKLEWTCRKLGLPQPVYKVHEIRPKRGPAIYNCMCKVGTLYSSSSYPESSPSEQLAKEVVAIKLVTVIESYEVAGLPTSSSAVAMHCLAQLVAEHEAGLWANTVPQLYREKYGEDLPSNWQELVENCPKIITDRVVNGLLVLLPNNEKAPPPLLDTRSQLDDSDLPPLQFPNNNFWNVYITIANSTVEIWLRIIEADYNERFEVLLADMDSYYETSGTAVDKARLVKNAWYAVDLDDEGWHRAKSNEIDEDSATVFLGDCGDEEVVAIENIKILEPQFRRLPAQAMLCRLEGCEQLALSEVACELVQQLSGKSLMAKLAKPGARVDRADPSVALRLYDNSTPHDVDINKEIMHACYISTLTQARAGCAP